MKKVFAIATLVLAAFVASQAQYVTKAIGSDDQPTFKWNEGKNYVIIACGKSERTNMNSHGIRADYNINGIDRHLYVWEDTYQAADSTGKNSFGINESHIALRVTPAAAALGWSGMGMMHDAGINLSMLDDTYYLHFAIKGKSGDKATHAFGIGQAKFSLGTSALVLNGTTYTLLGNFNRDGQWYYVDIPWSVIRSCAPNNEPFPADRGGAAAYTDSYFWAMSGTVNGTELHLDNIFFYRDASSTDPYPSGDVNGDGVVDIADVNAAINIMLGRANDDDYQGTADINGDGNIDIADVNAIINAMLGK